MTVTPKWKSGLRLGMILFAAAAIGLPFYWMLISALKTPTEVVAFPPT